MELALSLYFSTASPQISFASAMAAMDGAGPPGISPPEGVEWSNRRAANSVRARAQSPGRCW